MTGQENERGAPYIFMKKGKRSMNYDPELAALLSQPWSEGALPGLCDLCDGAVRLQARRH